MAVEARELTKDYKYGFHDVDISVFRTEKGLSPEVVAATRRRYVEAYERITRQSFADWPGVTH